MSKAEACSTIDKNSAEAGVQCKGQQSKAVSHLLLLLPKSEIMILPPEISEKDCV